MSLRAFHLLFIALSAALAFVFGVWALENVSTILGAASFVLGAGLLAYGVWFLRKTRGMDSR
jgi:hypothetical protein